MSSEAPRNSSGMTEEEVWASLEGMTGSERASALIDLVEFRNNEFDWQGAIPLAESAVEIAREAEIDQVLAKALYVRAYVNRRLERFAEGVKDALEAVHIAERYDSISLIVDCYFEVSICLEMQKQYDEALKYSEIGIKTAEETKGHHGLGFAYRQRFDVLRSMGRPTEELLEALAKARQAFREDEWVDLVLELDEEAARLLSVEGDYKASQNLLRDCFNVCLTRDESKAAHFAQRLGHVLRRAGEYESALEPLQFAFDYSVKNNITEGIASAQYEMAVCEWGRNNEQLALDLVSRARANFDVVGNDEGVLDSDVSKAAWLHGVGRFEEAEYINRNIIETTSGYKRFAAKVRYADNLRVHGRLNEALEAAKPEPADDEFKETNTWFWLEQVRSLILSSLHRHNEAQEIAAKCVDLEIANAYKSTRAWFYELYGDYLESKGDQDSAHHWWTQAIAQYLACNMVKDAKALSIKIMDEDEEEKVQ